MKFRQGISLLLSVCLLLAASGCRSLPDASSSLPQKNSVETAELTTLHLLYNSSDSFNPYTAATDLNRQLCRLIFEPLVKTDNSFQPVNRLADRVEITGNSCTVTLRNAVFSDGSEVTAADVVHSFRLAKDSQSRYASALACAVSASAADSGTVVFSLVKQNPYFANLLDFPVLKAGSESRTDSDGVSLPPIGCGRYLVEEETGRLVRNDSFFGTLGDIEEIILINAPDEESISHYVEVGAVNVYYNDLSGGKIIRMSAVKHDVNLNRLVYIGVNHAYGQLSEGYLRYALSSGIDREQVCKTAYYNNALPAVGFFNPAWPEVERVQNIETVANSKITIENLEKIGYNGLDQNGRRINAGGNTLQMTLLVNANNAMRVAAANLIASQLSQAGITITVIEEEFEAYKARLESGNFQLYLGEVSVTPDMDLSPLVAPGGSAAYGLSAVQNPPESGEEPDAQPDPAESDVQAVLSGFYSGQNTIADVVNVLQAHMPVIPVCYRTGVLFCSEGLTSLTEPSVSDIFFSIENQHIK